MQNLFPHIAADFAVELCGVEIVAVEQGTERLNVVAGGDGVFADGRGVAVDEINVSVVLQARRDWVFVIVNTIPAHVRNFDAGYRGESFHIHVENPHAVGIVFFGVAAHELHPHAGSQDRLF